MQASSAPSQFFNNSIFWIEIDKIKPNPFQPRKEFDEARLKDLSESIRMYGILQPLVVTRKEFLKEDGGLAVEYELISGERRLRASRLAGLLQVPALIRASEDDDQVKLELAIIENLQREDLNPVDKARAFERLSKEFGFKHAEIAEKVGKSREYVTNCMRLLTLPAEILDGLSAGKITEGHTRPLLMLVDRKEEQMTLFKEIMLKRMTVREAESIARKIALDRIRKHDKSTDPELIDLEEKLTGVLGTRVQIEKKSIGGKVVIDFFTNDDLRNILEIMKSNKRENRSAEDMKKHLAFQKDSEGERPYLLKDEPDLESRETEQETKTEGAEGQMSGEDDSNEEDEDLYSMKNFSV